jgi:hypothetical protein
MKTAAVAMVRTARRSSSTPRGYGAASKVRVTTSCLGKQRMRNIAHEIRGRCSGPSKLRVRAVEIVRLCARSLARRREPMRTFLLGQAARDYGW